VQKARHFHPTVFTGEKTDAVYNVGKDLYYSALQVIKAKAMHSSEIARITKKNIE